MAQNIKVILNNISNETPNLINFNDTIKVKAKSKIALTSFNASFDLVNVGVLVANQSFKFYPNISPLVNLPFKTITIPNKTYDNVIQLNSDISKLVNNSFSAFEVSHVDNESALVGMAFTISQDNTNKTNLNIDTYSLDQFNYPASETTELGFDIDADGYYTTEDENLQLDTTTPISNILMKGGGVCYQYNARFNLSNRDFNSYMKVYDQENNSMGLHYKTIKDGNIGDKVKLQFFVRIIKNTIQTDYPVPNSFYNWNTTINVNGNTLTDGAWSQTQASKTDSYFLWFQKNGRWEIVYFDANDDTVHTVFTQGLEYVVENNYRFNKYIQQPSITNVVFNANFNKATLQNKLVGSATIETKFEFDNCSLLNDIYGFTILCRLLPINNYSSVYKSNVETSFYQLQNFEIACEIDTIRIKNYVGSNSNIVGRKNVIAYFTPTSTTSQSKFLYSYVPSEAIYLEIDNTNDIDLNSISIRFYNTYDNKGFIADSITCVLTNMM